MASIPSDPEAAAGREHVPVRARPRGRPAVPSAAELDAAKALALRVHDRLCGEYRCPIRYFGTIDPLSELIRSLLSHRTLNRDSGAAFRRLRAAFDGWPAVRDAPVDAVRAAIDGVTWPEQKAPRIQEVLRVLTVRLAGTPGEALGENALDLLAEMDVRTAREWLETLPGVGPKTSAAVLSFSRLRRPALPVDSHHHRVARRLGLLPDWVDVGPAHAWLERLLPHDWSAQQVYDHHEVLMLHGQKVCLWRAPACARCVVVELCPTGRARTGVAAPPDVPILAAPDTTDDALLQPPSDAPVAASAEAHGAPDLRSGEPGDRAPASGGPGDLDPASGRPGDSGPSDRTPT